jgi:site-specific DNA-methyltransferase (adenine-specific)
MPNKEIDVKWVSVAELLFHPKNPNHHSNEQIKRLAQILRYQGFRSPIVVSNLSGFVTVGHGRIEAAKLNGWDKVPVSYQDYEDEAQEYAHIVSDNSIAEWATLDLAEINTEMLDLGPDFDIDLLGLKDFTIDPVDKYADKDADAVPEPPKVAKSKLGDLYILGNHRLLCGSSTDPTDMQKLMDGQLADLWLTDPPYGVDLSGKHEAMAKSGRKFHSGDIKNDSLPLDEMKVFWTKAAQEAHKACKDKSAYYWFACQGGDQMMMMMMMALGDAEWQVKHELIWVKNAFVLGRADYHYQHEPIIYGWKRKGTHEWFGDRSESSCIFHNKHHLKQDHPSSKPVEIMERLIGNNTAKGHLVLDSFGGSGSTLIACEKTNRRCFMMELDPIYIDVIVQRWEEFTGQKAVKATVEYDG